MKIKIRLLIALCALLPFIGQAIEVWCDLAGNVCDGGTGTTIGDYTRSMFYKVTLGAGENIDYFHVGWLPGGTATDIVAIDGSTSNLLSGWSNAFISGNEPGRINYVDHGEVTTSTMTTDAALRWQGGSVNAGIYYFGYNTTNSFGEVGFLAKENSSTVLNEDWTKAVGQGLGPVHAPIPEPASVLMLGLGSVLIGLFRRLYSHHT